MNTFSSLRAQEVKYVEDFVEWLERRPDRPKAKLSLFNFWSERKRRNISDEATTSMLVLDYDHDVKREDVMNHLADLDYYIYSTSSNDLAHGKDRFRVILSLEEPVKASDLRHWRSQKSFAEFFARSRLRFI